WSGALVFNQVFDCYGSLQRGEKPTIEAGPTYQNYVRWLKQQDEGAAEAFWRKELMGLEPTGLPVELKESDGSNGYSDSHIPNSGDFDQQISFPSVTFSAEMTNRVQAVLRSHRLTLNTLMQGIWALLLHSYSGQPDVLFGTTVSGRQGDLAGVEAIVGMLINVLPVRVKIPIEQTVLAWLQELQKQQAVASRYAYASPEQIQSWSEVSGRMFDSLLVIENYPIQSPTESGLQVQNMQSGLVSTYGLTVIVKPGNPLTVMLRSEAVGQAVLTTLLKQFQSVLTAIVEYPEKPVGDIVPPQQLTVPLTEKSEISALSRDQLEGRFFAPSNPLELKLTQIWESVLGVSPLSVEDNFFDVGGDSLLAVQLFNQMQRQLDCGLPLATLFQAPNVRQFAALLRQQQSQKQPVSQWSSLVPIQTNGSKIPLFFHGGSADALTWARFSHLLGTDRPFYALQRPDLDGSEVTHTTVEALATDCVREMRMVQPKGPYLVGGHCLGGAIAFEIAQQLQADGEEVESVVLIDAYRPGELPETLLAMLQSRLQLGVYWVRKNYYYHGGWEKLVALPQKILQKLVPVRALLNPPTLGDFESTQDASNLENEEDSSQAPYEYRYARAQKANEVAAERYVVHPYGGRVKLFRAKNQILDWYFGRELGWQTVVKDGVELTNIPGFFGNLFNQRSTPLLVEQVKAYLGNLE
ncbi:MAG: alpha/beta fold hydrolase, partial [Cyanobacteria bacterium P01_C01_bin.118]